MAQPGGRRSGEGSSRPSWGLLAPAHGGGEDPAQPGKPLDRPSRVTTMPVQLSFTSAQATIFRLREWCSGPGRHNPAQAAVYLLFRYTCIYNSTYILYISHNKGVLWYTWGYIPDKFRPANGRSIGNAEYSGPPKIMGHVRPHGPHFCGSGPGNSNRVSPGFFLKFFE
jgi:hypothetical protein